MMDVTPLSRLEAFLKTSPVKSYKKGEIILFQGDAPRAAYIVKSGTVKAYNLSAGGDEKPIAFYGPSSTFPGAWVYGKVPSAIYYYEAFSNVDIYTIPRDEYVNFIKQDPDLMFQQLQNYVADEVGKTMR